MTEETVPKATVEALAANIRDLLALKAREKATMAQMIRWCVFWLRVDPGNYRVRGHTNSYERAKVVAENRANQKKAMLYLEFLATKLEDQSSNEGEAPCSSE